MRDCARPRRLHQAGGKRAHASRGVDNGGQTDFSSALLSTGRRRFAVERSCKRRRSTPSASRTVRNEIVGQRVGDVGQAGRNVFP